MKHCRRTEFAQIRIRLSLVRVRESKSVLQAVQTNQTLFIKLGNKRNVTECLTEMKLHKTSSNIVKHAGQTSEICFIKQYWMMFYGDVLLGRPLQVKDYITD